MRQLTYIIVAAVSLLISSCGSYNKVLKTNDYLYKYEAAKEYYAAGLYNRSSLMLQDVIMSLKGTERGEESLFLLAKACFYAHDYTTAQTYFQKYYTSYPRGRFVEEARYLSGLSLYNNVPEIKLDQTATYEALNEFQRFLDTHPNSQYSEKVQHLIVKLQDRLVEKEYLSAKLYYDLGSYFSNCAYGGSNYQACIITAENAIRDYPYTNRREDFAIMILRAKFDLAEQSVEARKEERYHNAIDEYYGFTNEFPESHYMNEAKRLFAKANKYVKRGTAGAAEAEAEAVEAEAGETQEKATKELSE